MNENFDITCPICKGNKLELNSMLYTVPFFNQIAMFTMYCPQCHFRHNDIFTTEERCPSRWTLLVDDPKLLRVRVIRSSSGTIRLPDFGIDVEPGPLAEAFITNVEGILFRVRPVVESAIRFAEKSEEKERGKLILRKIDEAIDGKLAFTLILEDPAGISGILPEDMSLVKYEELSAEEAVKLKGAPYWIDLAREKYRKRKG